MDKHNDITSEYLQKLAKAHFWGSLTVKFEGGRIVHLRKEENLKPEELTGAPKFNYADSKSSS